MYDIKECLFFNLGYWEQFTRTSIDFMGHEMNDWIKLSLTLRRLELVTIEL